MSDLADGWRFCAACPQSHRPTTHLSVTSSSRTRKRPSNGPRRSSPAGEGTPSSRRRVPRRLGSSLGAHLSRCWPGVRLPPQPVHPLLTKPEPVFPQSARSTPSGQTKTSRSTTSSASPPSGGCATRTLRPSGPTPSSSRRASRRCTTTRSTASTSRLGSRASQRRSARRPRRGRAGTATCGGTATTKRRALTASLAACASDDARSLTSQLRALAGWPLCRCRAPARVRRRHARLLLGHLPSLVAAPARCRTDTKRAVQSAYDATYDTRAVRGREVEPLEGPEGSELAQGCARVPRKGRVGIPA